MLTNEEIKILYQKNKIGEKRKMNNGQYAEIIKYENAENIDVRFEDGYVKTNITYGQFKKGEVKNPYCPTLCGVGYIGETNTSENNKRLKSHSVWCDMLRRCYDVKFKQYKNYGGKGITVCDEWKCYANFKQWFDNNYYELEGENIQLDKDILIENNKIYSPTTCMFIPQYINDLFRSYKKENIIIYLLV